MKKYVIDNCLVCSKEFVKTTNRKYCSDECVKAIRASSRAQWVLDNYVKLILHGAKSRAKRDNIDVNIDETDIVIPAVCPVLNIPLKRNVGSGWHDDSPSLDRINNSLGYIKGNVRVISNRANRLKCDATLGELKLILADALRN